MSETVVFISVDELCQSCGLTTDTLVEIVEYGIVEPRGQSPHQQAPNQWEFESSVVTVAKTAVRMKNDLGVNWAGVALALDLLSQRAQLYRENERLKRRLSRFLLDD